MNLKKIASLILSSRDIIFSSTQKWKRIDSSNKTSLEIYIQFGIPIYIFSSLLSFTGAFINSYPWNYAILKMISVFLALSLGVFFSACLIQYISPKRLNTKHKTQYFKLVIYSVTVLALLKGLANLFPEFSFLKQIINLGELYFIRIFWLGLEPMLNLDNSKKISFTIISALIIAVSIMMIEKIFNMIFNIPILSI